MTIIRTPNDLVQLLKSRRLELGESQSQFAARIRKTQAWVSDFERNITPNIYLGTFLEVLSLAGLTLEAKAAHYRREAATDEGSDLAMDFPDEPEGFSP